MKRVLVFACHPDDDVIGCGGSVAKHVKKGNSVAIAYLTSGDAGSIKTPKTELARIREHEAAGGASVLGVHDMDFLRYPDGYLASQADAWVKVTNLLRARRPDVVYFHHEHDTHPDHQAAYRTVLQSLFRAAGPWFQETEGEPWHVPTALAYEVWSPMTQFDYAEDITDFMDAKVQALNQHVSQVGDVSYVDGMKGLAAYRGFLAGCRYAEVFRVIRASDLGF